MESFITVHYEINEITFQNRGSNSFLGLEFGSFKESYISSKISKSWLCEKKCKNANNSKFSGNDLNSLYFADVTLA